MKKLKPLLPTLKEKKRYLAFEIISKNPIGNFEAVSSTIWQKSIQFLGELGSARAGINIIKDTFANQKGIIKVNNKHVDELRASLCLIDQIQNQEVIVRSLGVSGILNKTKQYM